MPKLPRLFTLLLLTVALLALAWWLAPHRIPLTLWKIVLVTGGAVLGYWVDRVLFPYARPGDLYADQPPPMYTVDVETNAAIEIQRGGFDAGLAGLRRAIIVFACIIGLTMGL